jgi:hypothetical protein
VEAPARAIAGETASDDQLRAAMAFAEAQLDLRRIRDAKIASIPVVIDEMLDPRALLGLCALDRC